MVREEDDLFVEEDFVVPWGDDIVVEEHVVLFEEPDIFLEELAVVLQATVVGRLAPVLVLYDGDAVVEDQDICPEDDVGYPEQLVRCLEEDVGYLEPLVGCLADDVVFVSANVGLLSVATGCLAELLGVSTLPDQRNA